MNEEKILKRARAILNKRVRIVNILANPDAVKQFLCTQIGHLEHEVFCVMYLNVKNGLIAFDEAFKGTVTQTSVYPREIVKRALQLNATSVIFSHNHPSGTCDPSRADELLTNTMKQALALVDVRVLDHVVVSLNSSISFAERGLI